MSTQLNPEPISQPDEEFERFNAQFKKYFGADVSTISQQFQSMQQQLGQSARKSHEEVLRSIWSDVESQEDYDWRLNQVVQKFNTLPDNLKSVYDNPDGANVLWQQLQREGVSQPHRAEEPPAYDFNQVQVQPPYGQLPSVPQDFVPGEPVLVPQGFGSGSVQPPYQPQQLRATTPTVERPRNNAATASNRRYLYSQKQVLGLNEKQYAEIADSYTEALANGRVLMDDR